MKHELLSAMAVCNSHVRYYQRAWGGRHFY